MRRVSGRDGLVLIRDNFGGRALTWSRQGVEKAGGNFQVALKAGQAVEATLPKPDLVPPAPADTAEPFVIGSSR